MPNGNEDLETFFRRLNEDQLEATAKLVIENLERLKQAAALYAQVEATRTRFMKRVEIVKE